MSPPDQDATRKSEEPEENQEWENGNAYISFTKLMGLKRLDEWMFQSMHPAYSPGGFMRAYGGHVYAQAALAAARTLKPGFVLHSVTGHFLLIGVTNLPFIYKVSVVRDGKRYIQRRVDVTQEESDKIVFTCVCSFKTPEKNIEERARHSQLEMEYKSVLENKPLDTLPEAPGIDSPYWWEVEKVRGPDPFPGLDMRKVDMEAYNNPKATLDRRQLQYYRLIGELPPASEDPHLHTAAHLYASDRNGLFAIPNFLDRGDAYSAIASLSHTVVFHVEAEGLSMVDRTGTPKWFCLEETIDHISHGRALAIAKLWDVKEGKAVASTMQDGLIKLEPGHKQSLSGLFSETAISKAKKSVKL